MEEAQTMDFDVLAEQTPDEPALIDPSGVLTWSEAAGRIVRIANALLDLGMPDGSRLAVLGHNHADTVLLYAGAELAGVGAILLNHHLALPEIEYILEDGGAAAIWTSPETAEVAAAAAAGRGIPLLADDPSSAWTARLRDASSVSPPRNLPVTTDLIYTSGTTGRPKGVEVPLRPLPTVADRLAFDRQHLCAGLGPHLVVSPLYHTGPHAAVALLLTGTQVVVVGRFDADRILEAIERHRVASTVMVPTHFVRLLALPEERRRAADVRSMRLLNHTGSACPPAVKRAMIDWFGPVLRDAYGATESGTISEILSDDWLAHPGTVGRPKPPFRALVLDEHGTPCPPGQDGALYFVDESGRGIRYHNDPEKTAAAHLEPGTFTLGDIGHVDEDGYLHLTGRISDLVVSGGVNIYPAEGERVLAEHPAVAEVALFGVPDDEMGERLVGLVALQDESTSVDELLGFGRRSIAGYKVPKHLLVVAEIPRSPMGKVDKRASRDAYLEHRVVSN